MESKRGSYKKDFKLKMVKLYENGLSSFDIIQEYNLNASVLDRWIKNYQETGSFTTIKNNHTKIELAHLRKENQHLRLENDILMDILRKIGRD